MTPRRTRLVRVPDLPMFRRAIRELARQAIAADPSDVVVVVPTRGAARQMSRSCREMPAEAFVTRDELYDVLLARLAHPPRRLTVFERDSMMLAAASASSPNVRGAGLPFQIRPGLVAEMLRFYDQLRRQSQTVKRFQELLEDALGGRATDVDRGAERMLRQTAFLADTFRDYERRVRESHACDEHALRDRVLAEQEGSWLQPVRHVVVTVPDWIADPDGLFVADFDLLSRMPGLLTIDIVCTEALLGSGFHERLHGWWPGIDEQEGAGIVDPALSGLPRSRPTLVTPAPAVVAAAAAGHAPTAHVTPAPYWFTFRDREEELIAIARRVVLEDLDRIAIVFKRPLPYLYLAPDTLGSAGIPFEAADALPLAAEPTAAAIDLVLDVVETNVTRQSIVALLRTPHFRLIDAADSLAATTALDRALSAARYLGERSRLEALTAIPTGAAPAFDAAVKAARELAPLFEPSPASTQIRRLLAFLDAHFRPLDESDPFVHRERRARSAVVQTLASLADAHALHHDPLWSIEDLAAAVRRWLGEQTFVPESEGAGVQLLDDQAARYIECDDLTLVGLVENEWPERPKRNIFYPLSLLKALGWPSEKDRRGAAAARFLDLLASASRRVALSTFTLDDEALVTRSMLLDEVPRARLSMVVSDDQAEQEQSEHESVEHEWTELRIGRSPSSDPAFHGSLGPQPARTWSVSAIETYLDCPFKFFAQHVLRLQEEPDDEEVMDPRRQGQFVHQVFEAFFRDWQTAGRQAITPENLDAARGMFAEVVDRALVRLPDAEAGLERTRLLGSPAAAGLGEAVLRMEAERPVAVVERLLEHRLDGDFVFATAAGPRTVSLRGKADRLDLLADGTFRLIDYKLGWPPNKSRALQLPIYGLSAEQQLSASRGRPWMLGEAAYLAFKGPKRVVPLFSSRENRDEILGQAQQRLSDTLDAIESGEFPPKPDDVYRCETCSFACVCRKDYVGSI